MNQTSPRQASARHEARVFVRDTVFVFGAQLLTKLRGLMMMPLIIRGLGTEAFGVWSQILAFTVLASGIVGLNLHLSLIRAIAQDRRRAGVAYGTTLSVTLAVSLVVAGATLLLATPRTTRVILGQDDRLLLVLSFVIVIASTLRNLNLNLYRGIDRIRTRSLVDFVSSLVELLAIIIIVSCGFGLFEVVATSAAINALVALGTTVHAHSLVRLRRPDMDLIRAALRYGVPLIPASIAMWILDRSDRFVISHFLGQADVGIYSAHATLGSLVLFIQAPLQLALVPKIMQLWERDRPTAARYIEGSFRVYALMAIPFVATLPFLAPGLFIALANENVARNHASIDVALIAVGMSFWGLAVIETSGLYAAHKTRTIGAITAGCAMLNIGLTVSFVPRFGIVAAAGATALAYAVTWVGYALAASRVIPTTRRPGLLVRATAATLPGAGFCWLLDPQSLVAVAGAAAVAFLSYIPLLVVTGAVTKQERKWVLDRLKQKLARPTTGSSSP